jgi:uncharacterized protein YceH (UPF0502 family)
MTNETDARQSAESEPKWQPISAIDRRVLGVLAEKAKTTPAGYPMSLSAICSGCNQKSNRDPVMNLQPDDVQESLDRLRKFGATAMIEGYGRVEKYRHYLYEWLGVDKVELAVMAELLLRGAQTEGALRSRAARMEPISDLAALRPVLDSLKAKGLAVPLTPEGRGHVVTHALYSPGELQKIKARYQSEQAAGVGAEPNVARPVAAVDRPATEFSASAPPPAARQPGMVEVLRREVDELRSQIAQLRSELEELSTRQDHTETQLSELRDALGG